MSLFSFFLYQTENVNRSFVCLSMKIATTEFSLLCKRIEYISRDRRPRRRSESRAEIVRIPPYRSASRTPAWRARTAGRRKRRRKDASAGRGEIHRRAPDLRLGRHASWNSHSGKKLFYHTSPRRARFSARRCFAFYTGVEIWSLDSPMHHRSGPPLTGRAASSSSFKNGALRATFLMDSSQIS